MFRKIALGAALVALIGVLVFGAVNRTLASQASETVGEGGFGRGRINATATPSADGWNATGQGNGSANGNHADQSYGLGQGSQLGQGGSGQGRGRGQGGNLGQGGYGSENPAGILPPADGELSTDEASALSFMREEEKLAHDVYVALYEKWGLPVFQNISQSEQTHTDAVKELLDRYNLSDPASTAVGVFTDPSLQTLYTELVGRGSQSLEEALKVGAAIEEIDILDLQKRLALTDNSDIQQVFDNLANGSNNHLRAFVSNLNSRTGETYVPQYLSPEAYQAIISSSNGNGARNGQGGSGRGGGRSGGSL